MFVKNETLKEVCNFILENTYKDILNNPINLQATCNPSDYIEKRICKICGAESSFQMVECCGEIFIKHKDDCISLKAQEILNDIQFEEDKIKKQTEIIDRYISKLQKKYPNDKICKEIASGAYYDKFGISIYFENYNRKIGKFYKFIDSLYDEENDNGFIPMILPYCVTE